MSKKRELSIPIPLIPIIFIILILFAAPAYAKPNSEILSCNVNSIARGVPVFVDASELEPLTLYTFYLGSDLLHNISTSINSTTIRFSIKISRIYEESLAVFSLKDGTGINTLATLQIPMRDNYMGSILEGTTDIFSSVLPFLMTVILIMTFVSIPLKLIRPAMNYSGVSTKKTEPKESVPTMKKAIYIKKAVYVSFTSFFCQMDNDTYSRKMNRYQCVKCLRFVCSKCVNSMKQVGKTDCPMCSGKLSEQTNNKQIDRYEKVEKEIEVPISKQISFEQEALKHMAIKPSDNSKIMKEIAKMNEREKEIKKYLKVKH